MFKGEFGVLIIKSKTEYKEIIPTPDLNVYCKAP